MVAYGLDYFLVMDGGAMNGYAICYFALINILDWLMPMKVSDKW